MITGIWIRLLVIAAALAGIVAISGLTQAHAEPYGVWTASEAKYIVDLAAIDVVPAPGYLADDLIANGWGYCRQLSAGITGANIAAAIYYNNPNLSRAQAQGVVTLAVFDLCPPGGRRA